MRRQKFRTFSNKKLGGAWELGYCVSTANAGGEMAKLNVQSVW